MEAFNAAMEGTRTILAQVEKPGGTMYSPERCAELGYDVALFGLTLLSASAGWGGTNAERDGRRRSPDGCPG
jgi:hypothetical protein